MKTQNFCKPNFFIQTAEKVLQVQASKNLKKLDVKKDCKNEFKDFSRKFRFKKNLMAYKMFALNITYYEIITIQFTPFSLFLCL